MIKVNNTILHNGMHVAKAKLICGDVGSFGKMMDMDELRGKLRPIVVSEVEDHPNGFGYYNQRTNAIVNSNPTWLPDKFCQVILALPENLSDDIIKNISNGVLKNGDEVLVECEKIEWSMNIDPTTVGQTQIKFDSKNNITIHWAEKENWEKILLRNGYTGHDIIKITNELISYHESIKKKESWDDIFNAYDKAGIKTTMGMEKFLKKNYNPPTKK